MYNVLEGTWIILNICLKVCNMTYEYVWHLWNMTLLKQSVRWLKGGYAEYESWNHQTWVDEQQFI